MVAQATTTPTEAMFSTISKALVRDEKVEPDAEQADSGGQADAAVRHAALRHRLVNFGPLPFIAIERRMRPVEYSPAFRLDSAAVSTTSSSGCPPPARRAWEKKVTNGLSPAL